MGGRPARTGTLWLRATLVALARPIPGRAARPVLPLLLRVAATLDKEELLLLLLLLRAKLPCTELPKALLLLLESVGDSAPARENVPRPVCTTRAPNECTRHCCQSLASNCVSVRSSHVQQAPGQHGRVQQQMHKDRPSAHVRAGCSGCVRPQTQTRLPA